MMKLPIPKKYWQDFNEDELNQFAKEIFDYYRDNGFPYYSTDKLDRDNDFLRLINYDYSGLIEDDIVKQTMHGLGLAWSYFPHAFDVQCNNKKTPLEVFENDDDFMKVVLKRLKMGTYISDNGMRKMLKMYSNTQAVSNFRPTAAAVIYDTYAPNGIVWDMSGGWGGRLLGAIISSVKHYIVCEPSSKTNDGLYNLAKDYCSDRLTTTFSNQGSEDFRPPEKLVDLCFTSPPYFDLEKYAEEETQSYKKFPNKKEWIDGFLAKTINNSYITLKDGGYMLINIADPKKNNKPSLEKETIRIAIENGFVHEKTLKLALSNPNLKVRSGAFKYEPIFVFKKV